MNDLATKKCVPCEGGIAPLTSERAETLLKQLDPNWNLDDQHKQIIRSFTFSDFHQTMAFVNAVAWIAIKENHHPDMSVGYDRVGIAYATHAIDGLSENDFICAAKIDRLVD